MFIAISKKFDYDTSCVIFFLGMGFLELIGSVTSKFSSYLGNWGHYSFKYFLHLLLSFGNSNCKYIWTFTYSIAHWCPITFFLIFLSGFYLGCWLVCWPCLCHVEVPRPAMEPEPQQGQHQILNPLSHQGTPWLVSISTSSGLQSFPSAVNPISVLLYHFHL